MAENLISRLTKVHEDEARAVLLSALYFFFVLSGYYILRPLREDMGLAGGVRNLHWLFRVTLLCTFLLTPVFGAMVSRFPRRIFLPLSYHFIMFNLLLFFLALKFLPQSMDVQIGRVFYVWLSVINMFILSLFWAFMADVWSLSQSKRLFGFIAIGGSLGGIVGGLITTNLVDVIGRVNLLLVSIIFFEAAVQCARMLGNADQARIQAAGVALEEQDGSGESPPSNESPLPEPDRPTGGGFFEGISLTVKSPYLLGISGYLALYSLMSTFLYFEQSNIVAEAVSGREARVALYGTMDVWINALTLTSQLFLASRVISRFGVGITLAMLPVLTAVGFLVLGFTPTLTVVLVFQVVRKAANYAFIRPARETLFTIVDRAEKYKAKSFIDTFVYRGGDALGESTFDILTRMGMGLAGIAYTAVPIAVLWGGVGIYLGAKQKSLAKKRGRTVTGAPEPSPQAA